MTIRSTSGSSRRASASTSGSEASSFQAGMNTSVSATRGLSPPVRRRGPGCAAAGAPAPRRRLGGSLVDDEHRRRAAAVEPVADSARQRQPPCDWPTMTRSQKPLRASRSRARPGEPRLTILVTGISSGTSLAAASTLARAHSISWCSSWARLTGRTAGPAQASGGAWGRCSAGRAAHDPPPPTRPLAPGPPWRRGCRRPRRECGETSPAPFVSALNSLPGSLAR